MTTTHRSHAEWAKLVEDWKRSGVSRQVFAQQRDLNLSTFSWWISKVARSSSLERVNFVPVELPAPQPMPQRPALIELAAGEVVLRFEQGTEPHYVAALARELLGATRSC